MRLFVEIISRTFISLPHNLEQAVGLLIEVGTRKAAPRVSLPDDNKHKRTL